MRVLSSAALLLAVAQAGYAQSSSFVTGPVTASSAENSWQLSPVDLTQQKDAVASGMRAQRTKYFEMLLAPILKVQSDSTGSAYFPSSYTSAPVDIPNESKPIWLIASFSNYAVFPVGMRGAYTEVYLKVQQVIVNRSTAQIVPGGQITIAFAGGAFTGSDKQPHHFLIAPERYSIKPGGVYLLNLQYLQSENCFSLGKQWSVVNDALVPNTSEDAALASAGKSSLAGLSTNSAALTIKKALSASK